MKICLVQLGRIGDMILMTSSIQMIKKSLPDAEIYFLAGPSNFFIVNNNPNLKKVIVFDKQPLKILKFIKKLRKLKFDLYIDPKDHYSTESYIISKLVKAKTKVGFNDDKHKTFNIGIPSNKDNINLHFIERLKQCLSLAGIKDIEEKKPKLYLEDTSIKTVDTYIKTHNVDNFTILNFSASHINKMWSVDKWIKFIEQTKEKENYIIISAPNDFKIIQEISKKTNILNFPPSDFNTISALISKSKLLITPDTSCVHIAAAFDIPVISLTCNVPWSITKFRPLSSKSIMIIPEQLEARLDAISVEYALSEYNNFYKKYDI